MPRWLHFMIFVTVFTSVYSACHLYLYWRFKTMLALTPGTTLWALRIFLVMMALSFFAARFLTNWQVNAFTHAVYWAACVWMGLLMYMFMFSVNAHILTGLLRIAGLWARIETAIGFSPAKALAFLVLAATLAVTSWGYRVAAAKPWVTNLDVVAKNLPAELDGFTIAQISDLHLGVLVDGPQLNRIVDQINDIRPDLVVITGDLVDENAEHLLALADPLKRVNSRYGMVAVTGNHEYYAGVRKVIEHASDIGIRYLQNEKVVLPNGLILYGLNDPTARQMGYPSATVEQVVGPEAREATSVLLCHQPRHYNRIAQLGVTLTLSGHTHGGQLWPMAFITRRVFEHAEGVYNIGDSVFYVSRGLGTWGPPMRVGSPPELVIARLRKPLN